MSSINNILSSSVSFEPFTPEGQVFGKIKLNPLHIDTTEGAPPKTLDIRIKVDNSGSMRDTCADGRRKMDHVLFASEQLLRKIQESSNVVATASVSSFDDEIVDIFVNQAVTADNIDKMSAQMRRVAPRGSTDIYRVLKSETNVTPNEDPTVESLFILLTDGHATTGVCTDYSSLISQALQIRQETMMILVGCGTDHDHKLFTGIQRQRNNSEYLFVSDIEKTMETCSETIYKILNAVATHVTIEVEGGEIYDWLTNTWVTKINVSNLTAGIEKTYNVRSTTPDQFVATVNATNSQTLETGTHEVHNRIVGENLATDKYRQRTLEALFEANKVNNGYSRKSEIKEAKKSLTSLMVEMKKYMDENGLREDKMLKLLCDDIWTCHQTIGTMYGEMYTCARQTSQATQTIYCALPPPCARRGLTTRISQMAQDDDEDEDNGNGAPRATPRASKRGWGLQIPTLQRGMSMQVSTMQFEDDEEDEEDPLEDDFMGDIRNCSMAYQRIPKRRGAVLPICPEEESDELEGDMIMQMHETSITDDSPYAVEGAVAFIRGVSAGSNANVV